MRIRNTTPRLGRTALAAGLLFGAIAATPAVAADRALNRTASESEPRSAAPAARNARGAAAGDQRVCVRTEVTGSRLTRTICKTQAEWDAAGGYEAN
jgi:hypothetical protein